MPISIELPFGWESGQRGHRLEMQCWCAGVAKSSQRRFLSWDRAERVELEPRWLSDLPL